MKPIKIIAVIALISAFSIASFNFGRASWSEPEQHIPTVMEVQQRLIELGYDVGPVDGIMGDRTSRALEEYSCTHHALAYFPAKEKK